MKKNTFSMLADARRRHRSWKPSISLSHPAAFSLLGFWQVNKIRVLLAAAFVALIILFVWLILRRRHDAFPQIQLKLDNPSPDKDMTLIEGLTDSGSSAASGPRPRPQPGIYGKIEVLVSGQPISTYLVTDNPLIVGRDPSQALVIIQEAIVSKLHCSIFVRDGKAFIKDYNSTNGTYVNEEKVSEQEMKDNDIVFLGKKGTVKIIYHK